MPKLLLSDIVDLRQYERDREVYRSSIIRLKQIRRVSLGDLITLVFENKETIRFQIQEMARAEKMIRDDQIENELTIYNPLIPEPGELKATLFLELTTKEQLEIWLPALVGIEERIYIQLGSGDGSTRIFSQSEGAHKEQLSRADITASVHYIEWTLGDDLQAKFSGDEVFLGVDHPKYQACVQLSTDTLRSLVGDWK